MPKRKPIPLDFEIDKLTNSIENTLTGESHPTEISPVTVEDLAKIKNEATWQFNWGMEYRLPKRKLYKLTTTENPQTIQGLMSMELEIDHVFVHLLENAKLNLGKNKIYLGVPGNLVAYACKISFEKGFEGNVVFVAKTKLIEHYQKTLGAFPIGNRMIISTLAAQNLIKKYFNT
jgi:hypothetical protein